MAVNDWLPSWKKCSWERPTKLLAKQQREHDQEKTIEKCG